MGKRLEGQKPKAAANNRCAMTPTARPACTTHSPGPVLAWPLPTDSRGLLTLHSPLTPTLKYPHTHTLMLRTPTDPCSRALRRDAIDACTKG